MKQIVFFVEMKVTIRDEIRLGLNYFSKKGLKIKILNVAPFTRAKYFKNYSPVGQIKSHKEEILLNKKKIIDAISKLDKNAFVFFLLGRYNKVKFIIAEIEKRNIKYGYIFNDRLPVKPKSNLEIIELSLRFPFSAAKQVIYKINTKIGFGKKPHFIFCSGKKVYNYYKIKYKNSRIISIPSFNHDKFILSNRRALNTFKKSKDYAVYLDANSPDKWDRGQRFPLEKLDTYNSYYNPRLNFFKKFKKITNLNLKMAAHPKSNYKKNPYAEIGEIYYGKTLELISQCKIVLTSYSTALTWAVLFRKPILFFLSDTDQYDHKRYTQAVAEYFQKKPINVSNLSFDKEIFEKEMKVNKKKYEIFKKDFIINLKDQNKTSYEIIYKNLKIL